MLAQAKRIASFFMQHEASIFFEGQVREIPKWQQWSQARFVSGEWPPLILNSTSAAAKATAEVYQNVSAKHLRCTCLHLPACIAFAAQHAMQPPRPTLKPRRWSSAGRVLVDAAPSPPPIPGGAQPQHGLPPAHRHHPLLPCSR